MLALILTLRFGSDDWINASLPAKLPYLLTYSPNKAAHSDTQSPDSERRL